MQIFFRLPLFHIKVNTVFLETLSMKIAIGQSYCDFVSVFLITLLKYGLCKAVT